MSSNYGRQAAQSRLNNHHVQTNPTSSYYVWVIPRAKSPSNQPEREVCHLFFSLLPLPSPPHTHTHTHTAGKFVFSLCAQHCKASVQLSFIKRLERQIFAVVGWNGLVVVGALTFFMLVWSCLCVINDGSEKPCWALFYTSGVLWKDERMRKLWLAFQFFTVTPFTVRHCSLY